jgi:hypothetical protein
MIKSYLQWLNNNMYFYQYNLAHFLSLCNKNTMMNWNKKWLVAILALILGSFLCSAKGLPTDISKGFSTGNAALISGFFRNTVELNINNTENIYSSTQAEIILKDFFKKHPPSEFKVLHNGGQGESKYAIGTLVTSMGNFRVTLLIKTTDSKPYIHQLRIEKDGV